MILPTELTSFNEFKNSLLVDFNTRDVISTDLTEDNWRQWGNIVATSPTFSGRGVPTTESFPTWRSWGIMMYNTMAR